MIFLKSLSAESFTLDSITLEWTWKDTTEFLSNYTLDILRAEGQVVEDDYTLVASGISPEALGYTDTTISGLLRNKWRSIYYVLKIKDKNAPSVYSLSDAVTLSYYPSNYAQEVIRRKNLGLGRYGKDIAVVKRRSFGTRCPDCWDSTLYRRSKEDCDSCYDTGWLYGYFNPIIVKGVITPVVEDTQISIFGEWQVGNSLFVMGNYPRLKNKDVIVDNLNRRFRIEEVIPTEFTGALITQRARVSFIDKTDIIYNYPVTI